MPSSAYAATFIAANVRHATKARSAATQSMVQGSRSTSSGGSTVVGVGWSWGASVVVVVSSGAAASVVVVVSSGAAASVVVVVAVGSVNACSKPIAVTHGREPSEVEQSMKLDSRTDQLLVPSSKPGFAFLTSPLMRSSADVMRGPL